MSAFARELKPRDTRCREWLVRCVLDSGNQVREHVVHELTTELGKLILLVIIKCRFKRARRYSSWCFDLLQELTVIIHFTMLANYTTQTEIPNQHAEQISLSGIFTWKLSMNRLPDTITRCPWILVNLANYEKMRLVVSNEPVQK